jgi:CheY-like chemotaxis protein
MAKETFSILLVEDEPDQAELTALQLRRLDASKFGDFSGPPEVRIVRNQDEADDQVRSNEPIHLVLLDLKYPWREGRVGPEYSGMEWLPELSRLRPTTAVVVLTAFPFEDDLQNAVFAIRDKGAHDFIPKTAPWSVIRARLELAFDRARTVRLNRRLLDDAFILLRSQTLLTHVEDIQEVVTRAEYWLQSVAQRIETGDSVLIESAPAAIRGHATTLQREIALTASKLQAQFSSRVETEVLGRWLHHLSEPYSVFSKGAKIEVKGTPNVTATTRFGDLKVALHEILVNAIEAMECVMNRSITIEFEKNKEYSTIVITDTGPGFRAPQEAFNSNYTTKEGNHRGRGLYAVQRILTRLGGRAEAGNLQGAAADGAFVKLRFPDLRTA